MFKSMLCTLMWARSHLFKEVKSSKSVRVEKALGCIFFLARSPDSASKALEKSLWTQKFTCPPPPSNILTYLAEEITSPSKSSHWNSHFFLHLWSDHPQSPPRAPHYSADFGPVEHELRSLLALLYFHSYWFFQLIMPLYKRLPNVYVHQSSKYLTSCLHTTLKWNVFLNRGLILEQPQLPVQQALFSPPEPSFI